MLALRVPPSQEAMLGRWRSFEHSSGGWQLEASIAGGCDEKAEQRSTGVVSCISWPDVHTALRHGLGKVPTR